MLFFFLTLISSPGHGEGLAALGAAHAAAGQWPELILASELTFDAERLGALAETLEGLAGPGTVALLATSDGAPGDAPRGPVIDRRGVDSGAAARTQAFYRRMVEGAAASAPWGAAPRGDDPGGDGGVPKGWRPADLGELAAGVGLGRIVALYYHSSASYQIH